MKSRALLQAALLQQLTDLRYHSIFMGTVKFKATGREIVLVKILSKFYIIFHGEPTQLTNIVSTVEINQTVELGTDSGTATRS